MNFQSCLKKLFDSEEFIKFKKENPEAFFCSGFFTIDKEGKDNQQHIDYYIPSLKKLFSFKLNENPIIMINTEIQEDFTPSKIKDNVDFDLNNIENQVSEEMKNQKINNKIQKLIFSLQSINNEDYIIGTIFLSGLGLIKLRFNIDKNKITHFDKKSFLDMMNIFKKKTN